jgi:excinuclease ABC subunit C
MRKSLSVKNINRLPKAPGIYFLKNKKGEIFYVGKTNNLRARAHSHRNNPQSHILENIHKIEYIRAANEIEALLKESEYIKKYDPKMNYRLRDDKKYFYVGITNEELPRIFTTHQPNTAAKPKVKNENSEQRVIRNSLPTISYIGPFTDGEALKITMKYLRRIFPYYTTNPKRPLQTKIHGLLSCSWCNIGLCPGPFTNWRKRNKTEYRKNTKRIKNILQGKQKSVVAALKREMKTHSTKQNFERAQELKNILGALENIFEHKNFVLPWRLSTANNKRQAAKDKYLAKLLGSKKPIKTIESYDVSNIQGKEATASMARFSNGKPNKNLYRKFNIEAPSEPNDYLMMREVIRRRLKNNWPLPDMFLIDGGRGQLNTALTELRNFLPRDISPEDKQFSPLQKISRKKAIFLPARGLPKGDKIKQVHIVALAKREEKLYIQNHNKPIPLETMPREVENLLRHARDEAHRFAVSHHRTRHRKQSLS